MTTNTNDDATNTNDDATNTNDNATNNIVAPGVTGFNGVYGHGAFLLHNRTLAVVGGFHGTVSNTMLAYTLPSSLTPGPNKRCSRYSSQVRLGSKASIIQEIWEAKGG